MTYFNRLKYFVRHLSTFQGGYSIIEVMISLAIFAVGIMSVATLQIIATNGNTSARKYSEASEIAQGQIESLMAMPYASVADETILTAEGYTLQRTILYQQDINGDGNSDIMEVQVIVNDPSGKKRADLRFKKSADF
jgi:prepilin-type N-terminal cleavage/methylation domain-containing protein